MAIRNRADGIVDALRDGWPEVAIYEGMAMFGAGVMLLTWVYQDPTVSMELAGWISATLGVLVGLLGAIAERGNPC